MRIFSSPRLRLGICGLLAVAGVWAQTPSRMAFEAASVRPADALKSTDKAKLEGGMQINGAQVDATNVSLADLVRRAYGLSAVAFAGPGWMASSRYDIHAKLPSGGTAAQVPAMLQTLLAERFQLTFHYQNQDRQVYALTVGKNGSSLKEAEPDPPGTAAKRMEMSEGALRLDRNMTMPALCDFVGGFVDRPVVDQTGLTATYHVVLEIPLDELKRAKVAAEGARAGGDSAADPMGGSAMINVVQQLGLKIEPRKISINVLTVDHAEKVPTEN